MAGSRHLTLDGYVMGTPAYMSPEQVRGAEVDPRMDLYAVSVILYQLLTRRLPFEGDTPLVPTESFDVGVMVPTEQQQPREFSALLTLEPDTLVVRGRINNVVRVTLSYRSITAARYSRSRGPVGLGGRQSQGAAEAPSASERQP